MLKFGLIFFHGIYYTTLHKVCTLCFYYCEILFLPLREEIICSFIFISLVPGTNLWISKFFIVVWWVICGSMNKRASQGWGEIRAFCPQLDKQKGWEEKDHLSDPMKKIRKNKNDRTIFYIPWPLFKRKLSFKFFLNKGTRKGQCLSSLTDSSGRLKWQLEKKLSWENRK